MFGIDAGDVRIGFYNWMVVGLMAILFIVVLKLLTTKFPIPGLTEVVHSV
ncbi:hypothetical protein phiG2_12 [Lysinibacillus phage phiG2]|nr:hypothetical protein phiG2_12 [Lysinibacillus phage phiG2]